MCKRPQAGEVFVVLSSYLGGRTAILSSLNSSNGLPSNSIGKNSKAPVFAGALLKVALAAADSFVV